jgi:NADH pyrophosphatase NudC (nudix superfamily)
MNAERDLVKKAWDNANWPNYLSFPPYSFQRERAFAASGVERLNTVSGSTPRRRLWLLPCHWRLGHVVRLQSAASTETELVALDLFDDDTQLEHLVKSGVYIGFLGSVDDSNFRRLFPELCDRPMNAAEGFDADIPIIHEFFVADVTDRLAALQPRQQPPSSPSRNRESMDSHELAVCVLRALLDAAAEHPEGTPTERLERAAAQTERLNLFALRGRGTTISDAQAALLAQARSLSEWYHRGRFCSACGNRLTWPAISASCRIGRTRYCNHCDVAIYPRIDPVVIVLVVATQRHADASQVQARCLLGRKHQWLAGRYSCIAGFVEAGETLEEAVVREVAEESGIRILPGSVRYASSQIWPFPSQLMIGFYASIPVEDALPTPQPADGELESVAWFCADQVRAMLPPEARTPALHLPPREAIAHRLVADWLASLDEGGNR